MQFSSPTLLKNSENPTHGIIFYRIIYVTYTTLSATPSAPSSGGFPIILESGLHFTWILNYLLNYFPKLSLQVNTKEILNGIVLSQLMFLFKSINVI